MSEAAAKGGAGGGARLIDERYRALGLTYIQRFNALIRMGRAYQVENQVFRTQLDEFMHVLEPMFEESGEVVLVTLESDLYLNGVRIPARAHTLKYFEALLEELGRREIAGIRIEKGVRAEEMMTFFRLFMQPDVYTGAGLLEACLAHGADRILPAVNASTHAEDAEDLRTMFALDDSLPSVGTGGGGVIGSKEMRFPDEFGFGGGTGGGRGGSAPRGAASKAYSTAVVGTRSLLTTTSLQEGMEMRHAKRVVQPLIDGAFSEMPVVVGLSTLGHRNEYTYAHAVNVCMVATSMGHFLGMDRAALSDLSVAALLHDVGKAGVADLIKNPIDQFTEEEREAAARHPVEGARLLARSTTLNQTTLRCLRVALEHHAHADGSGYPKLSPHYHVSLLSRLVAIADCYVSLQTHRSERGQRVTAHETLGMMLGPLKDKFEPALLWALVQTVGLYPPGQLVELDDHAIAVVLSPNKDDPERPNVRVTREPHGQIMKPDEARELRPIPSDMKILRAIPGSQYNEVLGLEEEEPETNPET